MSTFILHLLCPTCVRLLRVERYNMPTLQSSSHCWIDRCGNKLGTRGWVLLRQTIPYPQYLDTETFRFGLFTYLHLYNELSWGWSPSLSMKFADFSYTTYTCTLKIILHSTFSECIWILIDYSLSHEVTWYFPLVPSYQWPKQFWVWSISAFQNLDFWVLGMLN